MEVYCYCCGKTVRKVYRVLDADRYRAVCKSCQTAVRAGSPIVKSERAAGAAIIGGLQAWAKTGGVR